MTTSSHPAVDLRTGRVAVVMQDRPVVGMTTWLADVIRVCAQNEKGLQLVTPQTSRLTTALYAALTGPDTRWVVNSPDGHYDGRTGRPLGWNGDAFTPMDAPALAPAFTGGPPPPAWHHTVALQIRHQATASLRLGGALEQLAVSLTGRPPAGWGTAEPVTQPWDTDAYTQLCRQRAPRRTWLCAVGAPGVPLLATTVVSRTEGWVIETVRCTLVHDEPLPAGAFAGPIAAVAGAHDVRHALIQQHAGPADTTRAPHWTGLDTPIALLAGAEATSEAGGHALTRIGELSHRRMGDSLWYELAAAGEDPAASWSRLEQVMAHLGSPQDSPRAWGTTEVASRPVVDE